MRSTATVVTLSKPNARREAVAAHRGCQGDYVWCGCQAFHQGECAGLEERQAYGTVADDLARRRPQWEAGQERLLQDHPRSSDLGHRHHAGVLRIIEPIWASKTETAKRIRGRIEAVIDAAKSKGEFKGENPARWKGHLDNLLPAPSKVRKVRNHPALPYRQLPAFTRELRERDGTAAAALEFQILTAVRPGNAVAAK